MSVLPKIHIIKASAGTGKTFSLVAYYLTKLLQNPSDYYHTLGLTFTRKSAAEMKKRILQEVLTIAQHPDHSPVFQHIQAQLSLRSFPEASQNAKELLHHILFEYTRFDFQTLDSFFHRLVRVFAKDLNIPSNFQIEEDTLFFVQECIEKLYEESCHNQDLQNYLLDFIFYKLNEQNHWNIDTAIRELTEEILKDTAYDYIQTFQNKTFSYFQELKKTYEEKIKDFETSRALKIEQLEKTIEPYQNQPEVWKYKTKGLPSKIQKIKDFRHLKYDELVKLLDFVVAGDFFSSSNLIPEAEKQTLSAEISSIGSELKSLFTLADWKGYKSYVYAYRGLQTSALIYKLWAIGEQIKRENHLILMADLNTKIHQFLRCEPAEYLYWRLGNRYRYILIDEFQDTSQVQFDNIKPLIEGVVTTQVERAGALLVGDVKQAIYRWRGSQPNLFQNLSKDSAWQPYLTEAYLTQNFRSAPEIVNFVNEFFDCIATAHPYLTTNFQKLNQKPNRTEKGWIKIHRVIASKAPAPTTEEIILQQMLTEIQELQNCYDIAILVRTNAESRKIATFLSEHQIPFTAEESLLMSNFPMVQLLFEALRCTDFSAQEVHYLTVHNLCLSIGKPFDKEDFSRFIASIRTLTFYEQAESILNYFGGYPDMSAEMAQFLELIHHYESLEHQKNLTLWEWFEHYAKKQSLPSPSRERIKIMTVHQAKGLEFEVVMCPFLDWELYPQTNTQYWGVFEQNAYLLNYVQEHQHTHFQSVSGESAFHQETQETILENTNLLYVALTRAKKQFYGWFTTKSEEAPEPALWKTVSDYFHYFFEKHSVQEVYTSGEYQEDFLESAVASVSAIPVTSLSYSPWREKILFKNVEDEDWNLWAEKEAAQRRGLAVHKILEKLESVQQLEFLIQDFVYQGKIAPEEQLALQNKLQTLFEHPLMQLWFSKEAFVLREPKWIQAHQSIKIPDRIVIHQEVLYIVDFKTGQRYAEYAAQLKEYEQMIQRSNLRSWKYFGEIRKFLVYIDEGEIEEVRG